MKTALEVLTNFMDAWTNEDWHGMWANSQKTWRSKEDNNAERIYDLFGHKILINYEIIGLNEVSKCCTDFVVRIKYYINKDTPSVQSNIEPRLLNEMKEYYPSEDGEWGVNPISMLKEHKEISFKKPVNTFTKP